MDSKWMQIFSNTSTEMKGTMNMKRGKSKRVEMNNLNREGLVDLTKIEHDCQYRKNVVKYGYLCNKCKRLYNATVQTKVYLTQCQNLDGEDKAMFKMPNIDIMATDGLSVKCPECDVRMTPMNVEVAQQIRLLEIKYDFSDIRVNNPIAPGGRSYRNLSIEFHDDITLPYMKNLVTSIISNHKQKHHTITASIHNSSIWECAELSEMNDTVKKLLEYPDSYVSIVEKFSCDSLTMPIHYHTMERYLDEVQDIMKTNTALE